MVACFQNLVGNICLFLLLASQIVAAPIVTADRDGIFTGQGVSSKEIAVLTKRGDGTSVNSPVEATFDITKWQDVSEIDCWVMLCVHKTRTYRRNSGSDESETAYRKSGAKLEPFYQSNLSSRGTTVIDTQASSPEDFPWRSIRLGDERTPAAGTGPNDTRGFSRTLTGVLLEQNNFQGTAINKGYTDSKVMYEDWFRITFSGPLGPVCSALHMNPPDDSICTNKGIQESLFGHSVFLGDYVYEKDSQKTGNVFKFHLAGSS